MKRPRPRSRRRRAPFNPALDGLSDDELMKKLESLEMDSFMLSAVAGTVVNRLGDSCQLKPEHAEVLVRFWDSVPEQLRLLLAKRKRPPEGRPNLEGGVS